MRVIELAWISSAVASSLSTRKLVIFARHAESTWNSKNKSVADYFSTDANLSEAGKIQARRLAAWIEGTGECMRCTDCEGPAKASCAESVQRALASWNNVEWATSNLKRALLTGIIALRQRVVSEERKPVFNILSALQEISCGVDAQSGTDASDTPISNVSGSELGYRDNDSYRILTDSVSNLGNANHPIEGVRETERLQQFCEWINASHKGAFGIFGHSFWLNTFFKRSMALDNEMNDLERMFAQGQFKLGNTAVVVFQVDTTSNGIGCAFVPGSAELIYGTLIEQTPSMDTFKCGIQESKKKLIEFGQNAIEAFGMSRPSLRINTN